MALSCRHLKQLDRVVSGASFLTICEFECDFAHCRSAAVLCALNKIRCYPIHILHGALLVPYVPVRVTRGAVIAHRCTYAPLRCRTSQYYVTFIPLSVSLWNDFGDRYYHRRVSRVGPFYCPSCAFPVCLQLFSLSLLSFYGLVLWGWGIRTDWLFIALSQHCIASVF